MLVDAVRRGELTPAEANCLFWAGAHINGGRSIMFDSAILQRLLDRGLVTRNKAGRICPTEDGWRMLREEP